MDINLSKNIKATFAESTAREQDSVQAVLYKLLSMFKIPDLVEVPVLEEKKILSKLRKHNKIKREKKSKVKGEVVRVKSSSSESDVGASIPPAPPTSPASPLSRDYPTGSTSPIFPTTPVQGTKCSQLNSGHTSRVGRLFGNSLLDSSICSKNFFVSLRVSFSLHLVLVIFFI